MAATGNYITQTDVERRLTAALVREIFDDDAAGTLTAGEESTLTDTILDAEEIVEGYIRKTYGGAGFDWLRTQSTSAPRSIKRRCLDAVRIMIAERHPDYIRIDVDRAWERFYADMERLRAREVELAVADDADPEPGVTEGATAYHSDEDESAPADPVFLDGLGDY